MTEQRVRMGCEAVPAQRQRGESANKSTRKHQHTASNSFIFGTDSNAAVCRSWKAWIADRDVLFDAVCSYDASTALQRSQCMRVQC